MKLRSAMLVLISLLLPAVVAGAATAPATSTPAVVPFAAALDAPAVCHANRTSFSVADHAPAPTPLAGRLCGACSVSYCQGQPYGTYCGDIEGVYGYCEAPEYNLCPTGQQGCVCWYGPLP